MRTLLARIDAQAVTISRLVNVAALLALILVLSGSLVVQFGVGEQPCPLCLVQRSAMIGLAVGPVMNLLYGVQARYYALSILAAAVGIAGSTRQVLLHILPGDPGYGPAVLGMHLYTWALVTFAVAIVGIAVLLLWPAPLRANDPGLLAEPSRLRPLALGSVIWVGAYTLVIGFSVLPECGLSMCPDDPPTGVHTQIVWAVVAALLIGIVSMLLGRLLDRRLSARAS